MLWSNRHSKNLDFGKVVEGIAGEDPSFSIVYSLAKFVKESKTPSLLENEVEDLGLISELSMNKVRRNKGVCVSRERERDWKG